MSFLSRLFGGKDASNASAPAAAAAAEPVSYKDCTIVPAPLNEGGQWRVAGKISKVVGGETVDRSFIRADLCMSREEAVEVALRKGQQIIDQQPKLFDDPNERGPV